MSEIIGDPFFYKNRIIYPVYRDDGSIIITYKASKTEAERIASAERKNQVRTVDRSERIRTYNFPENRLSDHRVNYKANNLDAVMNGDLEAVIQSLIDADRTSKLAAGNS